MYAAVLHRHMGLLHGVAQLTTDLVHGRFNLFKALNAVYQQGAQGHWNRGLLQGIAQRVQIARQAGSLPGHLLAELEFFA